MTRIVLRADSAALRRRHRVTRICESRQGSPFLVIALAVAAHRARLSDRRGCICRRSIACCRRAPKRSTAPSTPRIDTRVAMEMVTFMAPLWRLAGNPAYDQLDRLHRLATRLDEGWTWRLARRVRTRTAAAGGSSSAARWRIESAAAEIVLSREQDRVALCINSFSTPAGGVVLPLVDVGAGRRGRLRGQGRQGRGSPRRRCRRAVVDARRARARRRRRDLHRHRRATRSRRARQTYCSGAASRTTKRCVRLRSRRRRAPRRGCATRSPPGRCSVRVDIATTFHRAAEPHADRRDPGQRSRADERVVLVAHVQEPGANDNASGCGTLLARALAMQRAIASGAVPPPQRHPHLSVARRDPRQRAVAEAGPGAGAAASWR